jgi:DNA invertase Pin-like site-specific DNA recombinase
LDHREDGGVDVVDDEMEDGAEAVGREVLQQAVDNIRKGLVGVDLCGH